MSKVVLEQQKYKDEFLNYPEIRNMFSNLSTPTVTEVSPDTEVSSGHLESTESPSCDLFCKLKETNAFDYPDSPTGRGDRLVENEENDDGGCCS